MPRVKHIQLGARDLTFDRLQLLSGERDSPVANCEVGRLMPPVPVTFPTVPSSCYTELSSLPVLYV